LNSSRVEILYGKSNSQMGGMWNDLPPAGSLTLTTAAHGRNGYGFVLTAMSQTGLKAQQTAGLHLFCPYQYFFSPDPDPKPCPDGPAQTLILVEQPFEGGRMLWWAGNYGRRIFILYEDGSAQPLADDWQEGETESDPTLVPPEGKYQPVRGFGKVWREHSEVRAKLGWALAPEQLTESLYQQESYIDLKGGSYYLRLTGGEAIQIKWHYTYFEWAEAVP
jgi:hypothetical protein